MVRFLTLLQRIHIALASGHSPGGTIVKSVTPQALNVNTSPGSDPVGIVVLTYTGALDAASASLLGEADGASIGRQRRVVDVSVSCWCPIPVG